MKIDELIDKLEQVKEEHGNLEVAKERDGIITSLDNFVITFQIRELEGYGGRKIDNRDGPVKETIKDGDKYLQL